MEPKLNKDLPVRLFDSAAINAQLDKGLADIPEGDHIAVIGVYDSKGDAYATLVGKAKWDKVNLAWSVMTVKPAGEKLSYGGKVIASW